MTQPATVLFGQFPLTAPDLRTDPAPGGISWDMNILASETVSEIENLQQDLGHRLVEIPGSNPDFGPNNTRGVGIYQYLSGDSTRFQGLPARIDEEFGQDPRVLNSSTGITAQADSTFAIQSAVETVVGVFGFAWAWSSKGLFPLPVSGPSA